MQNYVDDYIAISEADLSLSSLSDKASTLTKGQGKEWPEAWQPVYRVH